MSAEAKTTKHEGATLTSSQLDYASEMLKLLANPCRLRLVQLLERESLPVNTLVELTGSQQATVSGHLRKMKMYGIVNSEHRGREVWYRLENKCALSLLNCMTNYFNSNNQ